MNALFGAAPVTLPGVRARVAGMVAVVALVGLAGVQLRRQRDARDRRAGDHAVRDDRAVDDGSTDHDDRPQRADHATADGRGGRHRDHRSGWHAASSRACACPGTYTIQEDDTSRVGVADKFDLTFEALDAANVDTPGYEAFFVGLKIVIPC